MYRLACIHGRQEFAHRLVVLLQPVARVGLLVLLAAAVMPTEISGGRLGEIFTGPRAGVPIRTEPRTARFFAFVIGVLQRFLLLFAEPELLDHMAGLVRPYKTLFVLRRFVFDLH